MLKILISIILVLSMLANSMGIKNPGTDPGPEPGQIIEYSTDIPEVGDKIYGFVAKEIVEYPAIGAQIVLFVHEKTGAELLYVANDDINRVFDLAFRTQAIDATGLPHVFEHAVTCGSEKYPSKGLVMNLMSQTYTSFLNAMTERNMTSYPIASLSEVQLLTLADIYIDSCLHPMVLEDESIFLEEAWRYRLPDEDSDLTIEGTVYSEMKGSESLISNGLNFTLRQLFPGAYVGNESGGDPDHIPEMTWQDLKDYHAKYYHPSNSVTTLYGEFEDYTLFLKLLNDYFSGYSRKNIDLSEPDYEPITSPVTVDYAYPVEQGSDTDLVSAIFYSFVCEGAQKNPKHDVLLNTLTDLLADQSGILQTEIRKVLPYSTCGVYIEQRGPEDAIMFYLQNANPEDKELFKETVDKCLKQVYEDGFTDEQVNKIVEASMISNMLARENTGSDYIMNTVCGISSSYANTGYHWTDIEYMQAPEHMKEWNDAGMYKEAIGKWLLDSETTALVCAYPEPGLKESKEQDLKDRLAEIKNGLSDEEKADLIEFTNRPGEEDDNKEMIASVQAVTVSSLPEEVKRYEITDETDEAGTRRVNAIATIEEIGKAGLLLNAAGMTVEELQYLQLMTYLLGEIHTDKHTADEIIDMCTDIFYNISCRVSSFADLSRDDLIHPYLFTDWICLDGKLEDSYDLLKEVIFDTVYDDPEEISKILTSHRTSLKQTLTSDIYVYQIYRAAAVGDPYYRFVDVVRSFEMYQFLTEVEELLATDPDTVMNNLKSVQEKIKNSYGAVVVYAGSEEGIAHNEEVSSAFLSSLPSNPVEMEDLDLPVPDYEQAVIADININYNGIEADYYTMGVDEYDADMYVLTSVVNDKILYPKLRDEYGVYSIMHGANDSLGMYVITYRDPNVTETFEVLDQLPELVRELEIDQDEVDGYILSIYSELAMPQGELSGAYDAAVNQLEWVDVAERYLQIMQDLKKVTPETLVAHADLYDTLIEYGTRTTSGPASVINEYEDLYDDIINPFGAKDKSQISYSDVNEGDPHYDAVMLLIDNDLIPPVSEDVFGVDETATTGDLLCTIYVLAGGEPDPEAARTFLAGYALVSPKAKLDAPTSTKAINKLFMDAFGIEFDVEENDEPMTRGEFAEIIAQLAEEEE